MKRYFIYLSLIAAMMVQSCITINTTPREDAKQEPAVEQTVEAEATAGAEAAVERVYACGYDGYVSIRETASYKGTKLGNFDNGPDGAVLLEDLGEWMKIEYYGIVGYVTSFYVQDTPSEPYKGRLTPDDLAGVWAGNGGFVLFIFDNGTWEYGYDNAAQKGTYVMQNGSLKLDDDWVIKVDEASKTLEGFQRFGFVNNYEEDGGGYGCITRADFKAAGKALLKELRNNK